MNTSVCVYGMLQGLRLPAGEVQAKERKYAYFSLKQLSLYSNNAIYKHFEKLTTYTKAKQKNIANVY